MRVLKVPAVLVSVFLLAVTACTGGTASPSPTASASSPRVEASPVTTVGADAVARLIDEGIGQANAGQFAEAATTFNNVLAIDPNNKFALYNLGVLAQRRNDTAAALGYYDKALASDAAYTPALFNKAILLEPTSRDQAIALYEKIVGINPKASTAYLRLATLYAAAGQADKAAAARAKATEIDPSLATPPPTTKR